MNFLKYPVFLGIFLMSGCSQSSQIQVLPISEKPAPLTEEEIAGKKLTPEILWKFGRTGEYAVSPDNATVVYTVSRYSVTDNKGRTTIWSIPAKGGEAVCLTAEVASGAFHPRWNPSTGRIAYLTAASGDVQIWDMKSDGSDKRQLSQIDGGINGFEFSPAGEKLLFLKNVPTGGNPQELYPDLPKSYAVVSDDMMYRHWNDWTDYAVSHIFVTSASGVITGGKDIMEGEPFDAPLAPYFDSDEIAFSPDGRYIAYTCKKLTGREYTLSTNSDIYLYDTETGATLNVSEGLPGYDKYPVFSPDGSMIAFQSMATPGFEADRERLMLYHIAPEGKTEELTSDYSDNAAHFVWTPDNKGIWFISGVRATYQVYYADIATKKITPVTVGKQDYTSITLAGKELIGSKMSMSMATELFAINPQTGEERQLTFTNRNIYNAINISEVKERTVKTTDGKDMLVWVIYPPDFDPTKKYPAVLFCTGGPQSAVSQFFSYRWNFQLMAAKGYIIVAPNRRGLPTFGEEWNRQISGDYGGQNMRDYLSAIDDLAKEPYVDAARLGAVGASYGGFSVYWLAGHHQKRFKAFIAHCGMFNFESQYGGTDEYWFPNFDLEGAYWDKPRPKSYDFSPHLSVDKWDTPILVIHGGKDFRVPYTEGLQAFNAAQLRGVPSRLLIFPEESHWVLSPQNAILWQREFFGWLDKWLQ
ncbi:prolyl oligopeptidase [Bacteroidia bacterium]|nr:prolyl oligopeptidase [Bacteroidia bacterium]